MDPFFENDDQNSNIETRWDQIERRHLNSASVFERSEAAAEICKDLLENKEFISNNHLKTMFGDKSQQFCLDPNLVMELRHSRVSRCLLFNCHIAFIFQIAFVTPRSKR